MWEKSSVAAYIYKRFPQESGKKKSNLYKNIKPQIMKNAILTIGLFTLVMGLTSFTTPEQKSTIDNNSPIEINGSSSVGGNKKVDINGSSSVGGNKKVD